MPYGDGDAGTDKVMAGTLPGVRLSIQAKNLWFVAVVVEQEFSI